MELTSLVGEITRIVLPVALRQQRYDTLRLKPCGIMGAPLRSAYSASKYALAGF